MLMSRKTNLLTVVAWISDVVCTKYRIVSSRLPDYMQDFGRPLPAPEDTAAFIKPPMIACSLHIVIIVFS